jgi:hypothetical protein
MSTGGISSTALPTFFHDVYGFLERSAEAEMGTGVKKGRQRSK